MSSLQAGHLGDLGAALVDDQLSPETRDLALAHLASCPECQRDVEQQRRLKARLRCLAEPALPLTLALRLNALKPASRSRRRRTPRPRTALLRSPFRRARGCSPPVAGRVLAGAASLVLLGVGTAYAAGSDVQPPAPAGTTANVLSTSRTQAVTTSVPLHDPAFDAMNAAFVP